MHKFAEAYKNKHPFDFDEVTDLVERVHNPAIIMKNANGAPGVREFFASASGRAFMVAIRPTGEINDIATLFPKDFARLVRMIKTVDARELLAVDAEKAIKLLRSRSSTASAETLDDLSDAVSVLNSAAGVNGGEAKFAVGRLYTGSAADYERPSLVHVGTGAGSQVYGWGLYASDRRGVAEGYAALGNTWEVRKNGQRVETSKDDAAWHLGRFQDSRNPVSAALKDARSRLRNGESREFYEKVIKDLKSGGYEVVHGTQNVYEQTFFTDRAPGDESHLLKWHEPVSEEQGEWILDVRGGDTLLRPLGSPFSRRMPAHCPNSVVLTT